MLTNCQTNLLQPLMQCFFNSGVKDVDITVSYAGKLPKHRLQPLTHCFVNSGAEGVDTEKVGAARLRCAPR